MKDITRANASVTATFNAGTTGFVTRVKIDLKENEAALVRQVVFHRYIVEIEAFIGFMMMAFVARCDDVAAEMNTLALYTERMRVQDVVAQCAKQFSAIAAPTKLDGFDSIVIPIPGGGFPVVGQGSLLTLVNSNTNQQFVGSVDVYYERMKVSSDEWLKLAKRSRNAPRDLNMEPRNQPFSTI